MSALTARDRPALRSLLWPAVATLVAFAILIGLGAWQLERKSWKEGLLAQIEARAYGPPGEALPESGWPDWRADADEFRRIRIEGTRLPEKIVAIHGLAEERRGQALQGFYLFEPLRRDDGSVVVVNRGFVVTELRDRTLAALREQPTRATIVGLVRAPETRAAFVPENEPARDRWFVRNLEDIVAAGGLARVAPFYVDADATPNPNGWPRGGQTQLVLRNAHLQYALTWFGIAGALVAVFLVFANGRLRGPGSADELQPDDAGQDQPDRGEPQRARRIAE